MKASEINYTSDNLPVQVYGEGSMWIGFTILLPTGWTNAVQICCRSYGEIVRTLRKFRKARALVPASSRSVFGHCFKKYSLRWLASFNCEIVIFAGERHLADFIKISSPCRRKINRFTNEIFNG